MIATLSTLPQVLMHGVPDDFIPKLFGGMCFSIFVLGLIAYGVFRLIRKSRPWIERGARFSREIHADASKGVPAHGEPIADEPSLFCKACCWMPERSGEASEPILHCPHCGAALETM